MSHSSSLPLIESVEMHCGAPEAFARLEQHPFSFFLDSGMDHGNLGRFSFMGADPFLVLKTRGSEISVTRGGVTGRSTGDAFDAIERSLGAFRTENGEYPVPFVGGAVGFLSYDLGRRIEKMPSLASDDLLMPECCLGFYDSVVAFDHQTGAVYITSTGLPELDGEKRQVRARRRLDGLKRMLAGVSSKAGIVVPAPLSGLSGHVRSNFVREGYLRAVERARRYIIDGDIFEVNLSQRFEADLGLRPYELYRRLREVNPAPFACYLGLDEVKVVGASPERFLRKTGDLVETRPIKGTRRRGKTPAEDDRLARELTASVKDNAENMMIVDLERNDLGRVCDYGSVRVTGLAALETYPTVFHLTSTVQGRLRNDRGPVDLLRATFPGGSITGAPKVRAMEIIEELEPTRRSIYTGSVGYLGFDGNIDLNIVIRTFLVKASGGECSRAYFQAGGAVVYDSDPAEEYEETLDKARALFSALGAPVPPDMELP
jgi:para-aminobenzoate synthetase component I